MQNTKYKIINQRNNDTCHMQSLEKDFNLGTPYSFGRDFTHGFV
jgi:hypothetical protein